MIKTLCQTLVSLLLFYAIALGTCASLIKACEADSAHSEDAPRAHCTAPDGSKFNLPPLRKRSVTQDYTVEYLPARERIRLCNPFDCVSFPLGTTVGISDGVTGKTLELRCE